MTTPVSETHAPHALLHVTGAVVVYRLYDVGYELDLEHAARLVEGQATGRLRPTRGEAKALVIAQPPLTLALGTIARADGSGALGELSACCYDFGVISLRLRCLRRVWARPGRTHPAVGTRHRSAFDRARGRGIHHLSSHPPGRRRRPGRGARFP